MLPAGGAPELELAKQLQEFGRRETGLAQYAIAKFAEALEVSKSHGSCCVCGSLPRSNNGWASDKAAPTWGCASQFLCCSQVQPVLQLHRATPSILLQVVPRTIAENAGLNATSVMSSLHAAHASGQQKAGLDIETGEPKDLTEQDLYDLYSAKWWALKLATDAAVTVLRVDQIIMAKQAGGPKPRGPGAADDED